MSNKRISFFLNFIKFRLDSTPLCIYNLSNGARFNQFDESVVVDVPRTQKGYLLVLICDMYVKCLYDRQTENKSSKNMSVNIPSIFACKRAFNFKFSIPIKGFSVIS